MAAMLVAFVLVSLFSARLWVLGADRGLNEGKIARATTLNQFVRTQDLRLLLNNFVVYDQHSEYRLFLHHYYPEVLPDRIVIAAAVPSDLTMARNLLGVYFGLDNPRSLKNHVVVTHTWNAKKRTSCFERDPESVLMDKLKAADLVLWIERPDFPEYRKSRCESNPGSPLCGNYRLFTENCTKKLEADFVTGRIAFFEPDREKLGKRGEFDEIPVVE